MRAIRRSVPVRRLLAVALALGVVHGAPAPRAAAQSALDSECDARVVSDVAPLILTPRDVVRVADRITLTCPDRDERAYHLALVVDGGAPFQACHGGRGAAEGCWLGHVLPALADELALAANPGARVGLVAFGAGVDRVCDMGAGTDPTTGASSFDACIERLLEGRFGVGGPGGALAPAIDEAVKRLVLARPLARRGDATAPTDEAIAALVGAEALARDPAACAAADRSVRLARAAGITVDLLCAAGDCASTCLSDIAAGRLTAGADWRAVVDYLGAVAWSTRLRIFQLTVHERLGPGVRLVDGSLAPAGEARWEPERRAITWSLDTRDRDFVTLEHALAPAELGRLTIRARSNGSYGVFVDTRGRTRAFTLGNAEISVVERLHRALFPALSRGSCPWPCIRTVVAGAPPVR